MGKTFQDLVQETLAALRRETPEMREMREAFRTFPYLTAGFLARKALAADGEDHPAPELVGRIVDAVQDELAAEEAAPAELAVSVSGLRGSPARVAAELRQLAERVESGWLGTSSASGCDVAVARVSSELCACKVPSRYATQAAGPCWACGRHVPARSGPGGA